MGADDVTRSVFVSMLVWYGHGVRGQGDKPGYCTDEPSPNPVWKSWNSYAAA